MAAIRRNAQRQYDQQGAGGPGFYLQNRPDTSPGQPDARHLPAVPAGVDRPMCR
jgi:hypothetical protein